MIFQPPNLTTFFLSFQVKWMLEFHIFKIIWTCMRNSFRRCGGPLTRRSKNLYENVLTFPDIFNLFHVSSDTCTCKIYFKSFLIEFQRVFTISFWNQCVKISNLSVYLRCIYALRRKKKIKRWCWTKPYFFLSVYNKPLDFYLGYHYA